MSRRGRPPTEILGRTGREGREEGGWLLDPSGLTQPPQDRQARGRLLTEHGEDGGRGGPAGAVTVLDAAVVRAGIGAGGRREHEAAAGPLAKQGPVPVPGETRVGRQAQAAPAAQGHRLPFHHFCCWAEEQAGCWEAGREGRCGKPSRTPHLTHATVGRSGPRAISSVNLLTIRSGELGLEGPV